MKQEGVTLNKCKFEFEQDSHCCSKKTGETLEIEYMSDLGIDYTKGGFFVLKTSQWAVDSIEDLKLLFERIEKIISLKE